DTTPSSSITASTQDETHPRKEQKGSWRRTTTAASPITTRPPDLPTSSCPSPGELLQVARRPQLPQTADRRPQALCRSKPCLIGCDLHHAPPPPTTHHALRNVNLLRVPNSCSSFCFFPPIFLLLFPLSFYNYRSITLLKLDSASLCAK
ncbi:uncharacterized protein CCOS01_13081, partial [Colletotrichum costaricense]